MMMKINFPEQFVFYQFQKKLMETPFQKIQKKTSDAVVTVIPLSSYHGLLLVAHLGPMAN
jgi:hypothetical protein